MKVDIRYSEVLVRYIEEFWKESVLTSTESKQFPEAQTATWRSYDTMIQITLQKILN